MNLIAFCLQVLEILFLSLPLPEASVDNYDSDDEDEPMDFQEGTVEGNFAANEVIQLDFETSTN